MTDALTKYYENAFSAAGEDGSIYAPMSVLERAGHDRKAALLNELKLPNLSEACVVDYGVGSWGFGCIFPKLKECRRPIGVDISQYAIDCSLKLSKSDPMLRSKDVKFITSTGYNIKLPDEVADVVFAGECIEHIEDTDAFLGEIWRILKPNGIAIFTTPNQSPFLYRRKNLKWAMGFEHVALMTSHELLEHVGSYFSIEATKGYTSTIDPLLDSLIEDMDYAQGIACIGENDFHNASGLIVLARKTSTSVRRRIFKSTHVIVESTGVEAFPEPADLSLYEDTLGRMARGENACLKIPVPPHAVRCQLILWSHPWSGIARIETPSFSKEVDLYSHVSGCTRVTLQASDLRDCSRIVVSSTGEKNEASQGTETIIFRAVHTVEPNSL